MSRLKEIRAKVRENNERLRLRRQNPVADDIDEEFDFDPTPPPEVANSPWSKITYDEMRAMAKRAEEAADTKKNDQLKNDKHLCVRCEGNLDGNPFVLEGDTLYQICILLEAANTEFVIMAAKHFEILEHVAKSKELTGKAHLTSAETAFFLRTSEGALRKLRSNNSPNQPRYKKFGKSVLYDLDDVLEFIKRDG